MIWNWILSLILKFSDDIKVFGRVSNSAQRQLLQDDLNKLCEWADNWQMEFNVAKCKTMHIGSRNKQFSYMMIMKGHQLDIVTTQKDLGVFISSNLKAAGALLQRLL